MNISGANLSGTTHVGATYTDTNFAFAKLADTPSDVTTYQDAVAVPTAYTQSFTLSASTSSDISLQDGTKMRVTSTAYNQNQPGLHPTTLFVYNVQMQAGAWDNISSLTWNPSNGLVITTSNSGASDHPGQLKFVQGSTSYRDYL